MAQQVVVSKNIYIRIVSTTLKSSFFDASPPSGVSQNRALLRPFVGLHVVY